MNTWFIFIRCDTQSDHGLFKSDLPETIKKLKVKRPFRCLKKRLESAHRGSAHREWDYTKRFLSGGQKIKASQNYRKNLKTLWRNVMSMQQDGIFPRSNEALTDWKKNIQNQKMLTMVFYWQVFHRESIQ